MGNITVSELSKLLDSEFIGNGDFVIEGMNSLLDAKENEASFIVSDKFRNLLNKTKANVILAPIVLKGMLPDIKTYIYCAQPNVTFAKIVKLFAPPPPDYAPGIHSTAIISEGASIPDSCHIGPNVFIGKGTVIGKNTKILFGNFIGENTKIGENCFLYPNCVIRERILIGNNVIIHPGVCVGSDGFGYEAGPAGIVKIPQVGIVRIDDDVEIGANCTIDRARFGVTWIKTGVKIDNLVHVAHNVEIGESTMLIAQVGVAGGSKIGRGVVLAGQVGVSHGLTVGDGAKLGGQAGVFQDVPAGESWIGYLAEPVKKFVERSMLPGKFKKLAERVFKLEGSIRSHQEEHDKTGK